ncbi:MULTISPECIES: iron-sulfur cluster assembly accessory protein [Bacillales]|jgi:Fe-S cluster assembly iron-binding protein IscA|uniref:Heme biosynthesis protein HemY n=1 Tax=Brevibacillus aydinogluensis TaxID=927786 RepID=A0AA48M792_9BACL|nr:MULTISPECIES: iron-sulfur cluster assembly accessory protein [Bacillales]REK65813.1 MAG: heme biosynthesis protein HemY [Brevibacillus sp.]MBR8659659.1 iron-sulfur cluster assembly accessory protein [Brevibacillus sp. NL20B1]MDT3415693.1 Fe-S cluster assembly iron-binding protein IscA [Brevibacillus aydinogluensis]NNV03756.1 iron-sulfur cluster assembly accessory protein [Brevibacillus sp. MCWH]UFJ60719.1 iron-sulfur cluster assembly accessory protein [Anoxybacillus sediminis]
MKVKITRNAAKQLKAVLDQEEDKELKLRVYITHKHGDHAHYGLALDKPGADDEVVSTDKEIDVIVNKNEPLLDGVKIDYLYLPEEGYVITNPSKGNHGDH